MGQLAVSVVGAGVGFVVSGFNPYGAAIGWSIGSAVGSQLFGPDGPNQRGPRLDDLSVQASTQGQPITRLYGTMRIAGNLIWSTDIEEHEHEEDIEGGGKGGGGGGTATTFTYTANFAIGFCEGPIVAVLKLWADGKLFYDESDIDNIDALVISSDVADDIRVYPGSETQEPDALIQAVEGMDQTPAYRGTAYIVFENFELADYGNRIPNITALVATAASASVEGPVMEDRPDNGDIHESSFSVPGGFMPQRTDLGTLDFIGNVQFVDGGSPTQNFYRRRYSYSGEFLEEAPVQVDVGAANVNYWQGSGGPYSLTLLGPIRNTSNLYTGRIREQGSAVANYAAFLTEGINLFPTPLKDPDGNPFAEDDTESLVPGVPEGSVDSFEVAVAFGGAVYAILGTGSGGGAVNRVYRFPLEGGFPDNDASDEYIGTQGVNFHDLDVNTDGVWVIGTNPAAVPNESYIVQLALEDLEFIQEWIVPNPTDVIMVGPIVKGNRAIYCPQAVGSGTWWVVQLNDDGSVTLIDTGNPPGSSSFQGYPPRLANVGLVSRLQWVTFGFYDGEPVTLASIVADLCERAGLDSPDYDVSTLENDTVAGYSISRPEAVRAALDPLQKAYFFDVIESDFKLKFPKRGGDTLLTVPEDDLSAHSYGDQRPQELRRRRKQDLELPRRVHVQYIDPNRDYQAGEQYAARLQTRSQAVEIVSLPIVFTPDESRPIADALLYDSWVSRDEYEIRLGIDYINLDPADTIKITHQNATHYVRLTNVDFQIPGLIIAQGVSVRPPAYTAETLSQGSLGNTYESNAPGANAPTDPPAMEGLAGPSLVVLIDSPLLRDADDNAGIYHAGRGYAAGWNGYVLFKSLDNGASFTQIDTHFTAATMGLTTDVLGSPSSGVTIIDEGNTLNVRVNNTLSSVSDVLFYNRTQLALVGAHGRWEIIAFQNAELEADGTYTIRTFMRGIKGTDHNVANHAIGDYFILLSQTTIDRVLVDVAEIGVERVYKGVSSGQTIQETDPQEFTLSLEALKPLSPVHVRGKRDTSLNLILTWVRRTRIGGAWDIAGFTPLGEASESYSIDILNGSTVVRTISASNQTATYTAAQQVTDFGSAQAIISGRLYQVSATVGRGTARSFTV